MGIRVCTSFDKCSLYQFKFSADLEVKTRVLSNGVMQLYTFIFTNKFNYKLNHARSTCQGRELIFVDVCHVMAFHTSIYIKIFNYCGSILSNLNDTMQPKQHAKKKRTHVQIELRFTRHYFVWWKDFWKEMFKIYGFLLIRQIGTMFNTSARQHFQKCCLFVLE